MRIAVLIKTCGSSAGFGPSTDGDHGPPMAIGSLLPLSPTRNWMRRVGCCRSPLRESEEEELTLSSARPHDLRYSSSMLGVDISITCRVTGGHKGDVG